ncbi:MAG: DUF2283 domain-containing protein [Scytonematopsis contorta HA4267-MV1]|jgi:uncharacterized protein YuzE|nr:DUF2283 domain-containing protein [Scytonematopsis contorta HA4267-MV1]
MKITYDPDVDVLRIIFNEAQIEESNEEKPGVIFDYDENSNIVGLEIFHAFNKLFINKILSTMHTTSPLARQPTSQTANQPTSQPANQPTSQ